MNDQYETQMARMALGRGFIAALDQSGGSTPKALASYGVGQDAYANDTEMFDAVHAMRTRIMTSDAFNGERVLGAILFENTMDREVQGVPTGTYLWNKDIIPFVKCDAGLAEREGGVQLMKANPGLGELLRRAGDKEIFGTKMRSVVHAADHAGIDRLVAQQFEIGRQILEAGLTPIIEPEVNIEAVNKAEAEKMTRAAIENELSALGSEQVMLKLTLPEDAGHYDALVSHPNVLRVVALSGGYDLEESCTRLRNNRAVIASFSRVLTTGLSADQAQADFDSALGSTIEKIFEASTT